LSGPVEAFRSSIRKEVANFVAAGKTLRNFLWYTSRMIFNTGIRVGTITKLALLLMTAIAIGACTSEIKLPILYKAPSFTLTNQDGHEVKLSDFQGKVVIMNFIYSRCPIFAGKRTTDCRGYGRI